MDSSQPVAIYARVSSDRQARDHTIDSQLEALRQRVTKDGFITTDALTFIDDGYSGSHLMRPALERLRDAAYNGLFVRLYIHSPDRLARRMAHQYVLADELNRHSVQVIFCNRDISDSKEDQMLLQIQGVFAEYERTKIQERSRRGKCHTARLGAVSVFSTAPYGYQYVSKTPVAPARFEINDTEATNVKAIFTWVACERCSIREVCRRLQKQGILTRNGRRIWEPATVRGMLRNPAYTGRAAYGKTRMADRQPRLRPQRGRPEVPRRPTVAKSRPTDEWISVPVPAIVTPELFEAVAEQLRDNGRRHRARRQNAGHLLQGLVVCQKCSHACYGQTSRRVNSEQRYGYYRCIGNDRHRGDGQRLCHMPTVPLEELESAVWNDVFELLADPQRIDAEYQRRLRELEDATTSKPGQELENLRQHVQRIIARLIDAFADGVLEKNEFEPRLQVAKQRLKTLDDEAKVVLERETNQTHLTTLRDCFEQFADRVRHRLDTADAVLRRELIRALVKRIELGSEAIRIVYRIDLHPFEPGPSGGNLRHWVRRFSAAFVFF